MQAVTNTGRRLIDTQPTLNQAINYAELWEGSYEIVDQRTAMLRARVKDRGAVVERIVGREMGVVL